MLHGPIVRTMLGLAGPTIAVLVVQTAVGIAETFYVSFLGTAALAGVAVVFPVLMLMTMMSNGGIGGGVAASVARALGAGRRADADALVTHAIVLALAFGALFTLAALLGGPAIYSALGAHGAALQAALTYSTFVFIGAIANWLVNLASSALRGAGNVRVPAMVNFVSACVLIPLSPAFIFGFGPIPRLGIAGAGVAVTAYYLAAAVVLLRYLASGRGGVTLRIVPLEQRLFRDILRVGLPSALGSVQTNLTVALVTGAVGRFGTDALAGYGMASRLDYVLIPLLFGLGTAVVTMVGTNVGAGHVARARRIAWTGALIGGLGTEAIGLAAAIVPWAWLLLFSRDPHVLAIGERYLRTVGPLYGATGIGLLLYFAGQGAGRVIWLVLAGTVRLAIAAGIGWYAVGSLGAGVETLFAIVALASLSYALMSAFVMARTRWPAPVSLIVLDEMPERGEGRMEILAVHD
jgi:putative MATE family efflux protein